MFEIPTYSSGKMDAYDVRDHFIPKNDITAVLKYMEEHIVDPYDFRMFLGAALYYGDDTMIRTLLKFKGKTQVGDIFEQVYYAGCRQTSRENRDCCISFIEYDRMAAETIKKYTPVVRKYNLE